VRLHELHPAPGSRRERKRIGRGISAGQGKTSGRGQKGQGSRSSSGLPKAFEGGQMRLSQRLPKLRGFHNLFRKEPAIVNVSKLNRFPAGSVVDPDALRAAGLIHRAPNGVKVLGAGRLHTAVTLRVHRITDHARSLVEKAGGSVELLEAPAEKDGDIKTAAEPVDSAVAEVAIAAESERGAAPAQDPAPDDSTDTPPA
jgi:large subunit ribosomal protein L15